MTIWEPLWVSLRAAASATAIVAVLGVGLAYLLAKSRFPGRGLLEAAASLPIALPPTVIGYYLLVHLGGPGPIRSASEFLFGHPLTFTFGGVVVAQAIGAFPFCLRAARTAIAAVPAQLEQSARAMGLPEWRVALGVTLPLAVPGIVAGTAMAFGRALGDYGATVAISGLLPSTTTMPIALYNAVFDGHASYARTLAAIQLTVCLAILLAVGRLGRPRVPRLRPMMQGTRR